MSNYLKSIQTRWFECGIESGDTLLLHSNITRILLHAKRINECVTPKHILDCILELLGPKGTLITPLFNFNFTRGVAFDIRNSKSQMGVLTELARIHPESIRTGHPIYSFSIIGAKNKLFQKVDNVGAFSKDSPFGILTELDGKIGVIDLDDQDSMTYYHHVEEINKVNYRYHKNFTGKYTDTQGITTLKTYSVFVRDIQNGVFTHVNPMGQLLWKEKLYKGDVTGFNSGLRTIKARELFAFVDAVIRNGMAQGNLFEIKK